MAQNTLEIIIKANSSKAITEIKKLDTTIGKLSGTSAKGFDALKAKWTALDNKLSSPGGFKVMLGAAGAAVGVLTTVGVTVKKLADDFMNYAFQVEDFGRIIGATPEEASKLIQVADDVRLSVESMTTAMRSAITKGYAPTVQELGKMSDAYLAIQDPIARSKFLVDTFGRSGLEMAKLMELGSKKIETMGDSIEGTSRLMTTEGIKAAKDYYDAVDNLGDRWEELSVSLGKPIVTKILIPAITGITNWIDAEEGLNAALVRTDDLLKAGVINKSTAENLTIRLTQGTITLADANKYLADQTRLYNDAAVAVGADMNELVRTEGQLAETTSTTAGAIGATSTAAWEASDAFKAMQGGIEKAQAAADKVQAVEIAMDFTAPNFADKMKNLIDSVDWQAAGGGALEQFMAGFSADIANKTPDVQKEIAAQVGAVDIALRVETGEITKSEGIQQLMDLAGTDYSKSKTDLEAIMKLQPADIGPYLEQIVGLGPAAEEGAKQEEELSLKIEGTTTALRLGQSDLSGWNTTTASLAESSQTAAAQVGALNTQLKNMPRNIDVNINIHTTGGGNIPTGATGENPGPRPPGGHGATGLDMIVPPGYRNDSFPIYATSGERVIIQRPEQNTNNNSTSIINNYYITPNQAINVRELARQVTREQQRTGAT